MGVSQRLHPGVGWGCILRRSLTVTVGSASKMACSHGNWQEAWAPHSIDPPAWVPRNMAAGFPQGVGSQRARQNPQCLLSPSLGSRILSFPRDPAGHTGQPSSRWERATRCKDTRSLGSLGGHLKAGYHPSVCTEPGRYSWSISVWQVPTVSQHRAGLDTAPTPKGLYYSWKCKLETESGEACTS